MQCPILYKALFQNIQLFLNLHAHENHLDKMQLWKPEILNQKYVIKTMQFYQIPARNCCRWSVDQIQKKFDLLLYISLTMVISANYHFSDNFRDLRDKEINHQADFNTCSRCYMQWDSQISMYIIIMPDPKSKGIDIKMLYLLCINKNVSMKERNVVPGWA